MRFFVQQQVLDLGTKIVFPVIEDFDNREVPESWLSVRDERLARQLVRYRDTDVHADPVLEGFNVLHDQGHIRRKKNVPAPITLVKLLVRRGTMPLINPVVDIYNLISIESGLALGAHDIAHVDGDVTLRFVDGSERFVPLGTDAPVAVRPGEYAYCDDANEILCRLEVRQVNKTAATPSTTDAFFIVQGNAATSDEYVLGVAQQLIDEVTEHLGGTGHIEIPHVIGRDD